MTTLSNAVVSSLKSDLERIAKEEITIEVIDTTIFAYCSELASLRMLKAYRKADNADCGYSENLNTYYFTLETGI